jgi:hypothetical protein
MLNSHLPIALGFFRATEWTGLHFVLCHKLFSPPNTIGSGALSVNVAIVSRPLVVKYSSLADRARHVASAVNVIRLRQVPAIQVFLLAGKHIFVARLEPISEVHDNGLTRN